MRWRRWRLISKLSMGECITAKWRGKPVFIRSRTEDEIAEAANVNLAELRDPENDLDRVQNPETLVLREGVEDVECRAL